MARCPIDGRTFDDRIPHDPEDLLDELPCGSRRVYCSRACAKRADVHRHAEKRALASRQREQARLQLEHTQLEAAGQQVLELVP